MYADLEESFGTFKTCKAVYERIIDLKICTPQVIINYGMFVEEHNYFEEAYRAYEKGIALFKWPNVYDIWNSYLSKFLARYGGTKLERARDLFEQCLDQCPAEHAKYFYLLYAKLEEEHGLARRAMSACRALPEQHMRHMCVKFAELETKLGEVDRARAIYAHRCAIPASQRTWKEFEVRHGNEDTMREMLRIKRSIQATYNTQVNMMAAQNTNGVAADAGAGSGPDAMRLLEEKARQAAAEAKQKPAEKAASNIMFVRGETQGAAKGKENTVVNPDEIDIGDSEDDDDDEEEDPQQPSGDQDEAGQATTKTDDEGLTMKKLRFEQKAIPAKVFGSLKPTNQSDSDEG
ncbi:pre-mRNA-splicing factor syf1 homolog [Drosophila miranda]|uniref:pre-mRNA-splicing factor syf1 homolog n=1 Tax=Drosophila miranda TaxID=7229 RepID=UPI00143F3A18|nr:pre-mRNA-splicing factor syf1 homolog [Drosophila miranda]